MCVYPDSNQVEWAAPDSTISLEISFGWRLFRWWARKVVSCLLPFSMAKSAVRYSLALSLKLFSWIKAIAP